MDEPLSTVNAEPVVNVEPQNEPVKAEPTNEPVNAGDGVTPPKVDDKPVQSPEENAKYAAIRREAEAKAEARARDKTIAEMGMEWNGKPITTYDQYVKAKAESDEQARRAALQEKGVDPSIVDDYVNNNPTVKKAKELLDKQEEEQRKQTEYQEFFEYFRNENGRDFNSTTDQIPPEVWEMTTKGKTLTDAYAYHTNKVLKAKIAEYEAKLKAQETNEKNANSSPGSVTGNGEVKGDFVSFESFEANKNDRNWIMKNYDKIMKSRSQW